jgi:site-specific recombinase XerD
LLVYAPKTKTDRFVVLGQTTTESMTIFMTLRGKTRSDDPLFCHMDGHPMKEKCVEAVLRRADKAGLERCRIHPHIWQGVRYSLYGQRRRR